MSKRLAIAGLAAALCVAGAAYASVALLLREHGRAQHGEAERAASSARANERQRTEGQLLLMQHVCRRDPQLERLALELSAGGEPEVSRAAQALAGALASEVWIARQRGPSITLLAASGAAPRTLPSARALEAATTALQAHTGEPPRVLLACARNAGATRLWLIRTEPIESLRAALLAPEAGGPLALEAAPDLASGTTALALRIPGDGSGALSLFARATRPPALGPLLALLPLFVLLGVATALLLYFAAVRARPVALDDAVLVELEQAAERVARGDLSGRIEARVGGRADQTFRTFDRMTQELAEMRTRLAEAERAAAWQDMARRIAHEIKNPLSPIQIAIETLRKAHDKRLSAFDEIFEESTRAILEEVRRMEHIVREFSEFARLPRARPGALELGALVRDTVGLYQPDDVQVSVSCERAVAVRADREQITQVLVNLLQNAIDAARESSRPQVAVQVTCGAGSALVHVDDSGGGIAPEQRERVFEPYFTTKQHGTGLGLAIVRRIALDHDGNVQVGASPLGGARFSLRLPQGADPSP